MNAVTARDFVKTSADPGKKIDISNPTPTIPMLDVVVFRSLNTWLDDSAIEQSGLAVSSHDGSQWLTPPHANDRRTEASPDWRDSLSDRMAVLRAAAVEEDIGWHAESAAAAEDYARHYSTVRPSAFLLENGNVRLVWHGTSQEQVALEFFDDGRLRFVLFHRRDDHLSHSAGITDLATVNDLVRTLRLTSLLRR